MGDLEYATEVRQIDSIVLGALENIARDAGFTLSAAAKDFLITKARKNLDQAQERRELEQRAPEIESNCHVLMERVMEIQGQIAPQATEIDANTIRPALGWLCSRFPTFFPFCP